MSFVPTYIVCLVSVLCAQTFPQACMHLLLLLLLLLHARVFVCVCMCVCMYGGNIGRRIAVCKRVQLGLTP